MLTPKSEFDRLKKDTAVTDIPELPGATLMEITLHRENESSALLSYPTPINENPILAENISDLDIRKVGFHFDTGAVLWLHHRTSCCEEVYLVDIDGDPHDIIGTPIVMGETVSQKMEDPGSISKYGDRSGTWTFYRIGTNRGSITPRWSGTSNGHYSEEVEQQFHPAKPLH